MDEINGKLLATLVVEVLIVFLTRLNSSKIQENTRNLKDLHLCLDEMKRTVNKIAKKIEVGHGDL